MSPNTRPTFSGRLSKHVCLSSHAPKSQTLYTWAPTCESLSSFHFWAKPHPCTTRSSLGLVIPAMARLPYTNHFTQASHFHILQIISFQQRTWEFGEIHHTLHSTHTLTLFMSTFTSTKLARISQQFAVPQLWQLSNWQIKQLAIWFLNPSPSSQKRNQGCWSEKAIKSPMQ